ncbi:MAG: hydroxymethylbilane synthase [Candidatus Latescibacterota bacterium]|jgi:hydroxymethylbilane synthase
MSDKLTIGSRGSKLALWQANWAKDRLCEHFPNLQVEIQVIRTQGDRMAEVPLSQMGGKEVWTKEIEQALLDHQIDLAVHSLKDLPTLLPSGLMLGAVSKREDVRDALVSLEGKRFANLPQNARVATSSLRRQAQLLNARPDLKIESIRGNVDTRLRKLEEEPFDAIILASAGLIRLGFGARITEFLDPTLCVPAPGQAALGIETRQHDDRVAMYVAVLNDSDAFRDVIAEREMLRSLEGGCRVPIGAWARLASGHFVLTGVVATPNGLRVIKETIEGQINDPLALGREMANKLRQQGAAEILADLENV